MPQRAKSIEFPVSKTIRQILCEGDELGEWVYKDALGGQINDMRSDAEDFEFPGFSFINKNGYITGEDVSNEQRAMAEKILLEEFGAAFVLWHVPWVELYLDPTIPSAHKRLDSFTLPRSIGGCLPIWRSRIEYIWFEPYVGAWGQARKVDDQVQHLELPSKIVATMQDSKVFPDETVIYLVKHYFPDCVAMTRYSAHLVIELKQTSDDDFFERLLELPMEIVDTDFELRFYNGPLPRYEARIRKDKPNVKKDTEDSTDYVAADGKFYPGSMIASVRLDDAEDVIATANAGILVEKDGERRLTCSYHLWDEHLEKHPDLFGKDTDEAKRVFRLVQGYAPAVDGADMKAGTPIGYASERIGNTDICLAKLSDGIQFENQFFDDPEPRRSPKTFLPWKNIEEGDLMLMDSFVTGPQQFIALGWRKVVMLRERSNRRHASSLRKPSHTAPQPDMDTDWVITNQKIHGKNINNITKESRIRRSACGSVLVDCGRLSDSKKVPPKWVAGDRVAGMIHWVDVKETYNAGQVLMFSDSFDPLAAVGWSIVVTSEDSPQRVVEETAEEPQQQGTSSKRAAPGSPEPGETPSKKRRGRAA